jgi:Mn-containing catalase
MFSAALADIQPNFPPGVLQGDARFTHAYFDMSNGANVRGPWNQGRGPWASGEWTFVSDPIKTVRETEGLTEFEQTAPNTDDQLEQVGKKVSEMRYDEISKAVPKGSNQWSSYSQRDVKSPRKAG